MGKLDIVVEERLSVLEDSIALPMDVDHHGMSNQPSSSFNHLLLKSYHQFSDIDLISKVQFSIGRMSDTAVASRICSLALKYFLLSTVIVPNDRYGMHPNVGSARHPNNIN